MARKRFTAEQIIIFMSTEDGLADTIKPRLKIMGADPKRLFAVNTALTLDPDGFKQLESYLKDKRPMLVITDPFCAYFGGGKDPYRVIHTRPIMAQPGELAERYNNRNNPSLTRFPGLDRLPLRKNTS